MAHCNTIFHQMLKLIPRHHFARLEAEHGTGRKVPPAPRLLVRDYSTSRIMHFR